jgi:hypothetical protein
MHDVEIQPNHTHTKEDGIPASPTENVIEANRREILDATMTTLTAPHDACAN